VTTQLPAEQVAEVGAATFVFVQMAPQAPQLLTSTLASSSQPFNLLASQLAAPATQVVTTQLPATPTN
jgi:hypothetical protein